VSGKPDWYENSGELSQFAEDPPLKAFFPGKPARGRLQPDAI
jgi:hypothetical protein